MTHDAKSGPTETLTGKLTRYRTSLVALVALGVLAATIWLGLRWAGRAAGDFRPGGPAKFSQAEYLYGLGPVPDAKVAYQPDVVIVGGGSGSVRSVSADGIVWTIRGNAPHIDEVRPGMVMFVTSRGVGRVLKLERVGPDVSVWLGPVDLTDVIRDGVIKVDQPIDFRNFAFVQTPELPGAVRAAPSLVSDRYQGEPVRYADWRASDVTLPVTRLIAVDRSTQGGQNTLPPATVGHSLAFGVGRFVVEMSQSVPHSTWPYQAADQQVLVVRVAYGPSASQSRKRPPDNKDGTKPWSSQPLEGSGVSAGLELGITFTLHLQEPRLHANTVISDGRIQQSNFRVDGIRQIDVDIGAGSRLGLSDNLSQRIEMPVDLVLPVAPTLGLPLNIAVRQKFMIQTAFTAKNSTLLAHGSYVISGALSSNSDADGTSASAPNIQIQQSLLSALRGASLGVNGVVVAYQIRLVLGLGIPAAFVGPHAGLTASFTVTRGSDLGLLVCRMASTDIAVNGGVGYKLEPAFIDVLASMFSRNASTHAKLDSDLIDYSKPVFHWDTTYPAIHLCKN